MSTKHIKNCPSCFKTINKSRCYEKHIFHCERINNEKQIPSENDLYQMIQILYEKYNNVCNEVESLKRYIRIRNKKIDILKSLNNDLIPNITWSNRIDKLNISTNDLIFVFEKGFIDGVFEILKNQLDNHEFQETFRCYNEKKNIIYIFDNIWKELDNKTFNSIINKINQQLFSCVEKYNEENKDKFENETFQIQYNNNLKKLLNVNLSFESKCTRIKNKVYKHFKIDFNIK